MNDIAVIQLSSGKGFTIVDADAFPKVSKHKWYRDTNGYVARANWMSGKSKKVYLHRVLNETPDGLRTDHKNRCTTDNTSRNLRSATVAQNHANGKKRINSKSRYKGVSKTSRKCAKPWRCRFQLGSMFICQNFYTEIEAAHAWNALAKQYMGEYAIMNYVENVEAN